MGRICLWILGFVVVLCLVYRLSPEPIPTDDLSRFIWRYGQPDEVQEMTGQYSRSRILTYKKESVVALYRYDPAVPGWALVCYYEGTGRTIIDESQARVRMAHRDKHPEPQKPIQLAPR